jgi:hypothetical protein
VKFIITPAEDIDLLQVQVSLSPDAAGSAGTIFVRLSGEIPPS